jgi:hypothetical protein
VGGKLLTNHLKEIVSYRYHEMAIAAVSYSGNARDGNLLRAVAVLRNGMVHRGCCRQWNMMDETYIMNHVKEQCCFVSADPLRDLAAVQYVPRPAFARAGHFCGACATLNFLVTYGNTGSCTAE